MAENTFWQNLIKKIIKILLKSIGIGGKSATNNQHVVPYKDYWAVKKEGSDDITESFETQEEAIQRAKEIARNYNSNVVIHRKDGTIRDVVSY